MERLLVVEDDRSVRTTITTFLELEGYAVDAASSTREALERLRERGYPVVISDIYLDERTGLDVLENARSWLGSIPASSSRSSSATEAASKSRALPAKAPASRSSCPPAPRPRE